MLEENINHTRIYKYIIFFTLRSLDNCPSGFDSCCLASALVFVSRASISLPQLLLVSQTLMGVTLYQQRDAQQNTTQLRLSNRPALHLLLHTHAAFVLALLTWITTRTAIKQTGSSSHFDYLFCLFFMSVFSLWGFELMPYLREPKAARTRGLQTITTHTHRNPEAI